MENEYLTLEQYYSDMQEIYGLIAEVLGVMKTSSHTQEDITTTLKIIINRLNNGTGNEQ